MTCTLCDQAHVDTLYGQHTDIDFRVCRDHMEELKQWIRNDTRSLSGSLKEEASERWGDEWFKETIEYADGDVQKRIVHTEQVVKDDVVVREILTESGVSRCVVRTREVIE